MSWLRRSSVLGLTLLLGLGVSCTTNDSSPTGVPVAGSAEQPAPSFGLIGDLEDGLTSTTDDLTGTLVGTLNLLTCSEQPYVKVTKTIGPEGGEILVGTHRLDFPKGALSKKTKITAEQMSGSTNSVRFGPEELRFEKRPKLTMSYENCVVVLLDKKIVYTTEQFKILEVLRSLDLFHKKTVTAPIDHFSRYALAY